MTSLPRHLASLIGAAGLALLLAGCAGGPAPAPQDNPPAQSGSGDSGLDAADAAPLPAAIIERFEQGLAAYRAGHHTQAEGIFLSMTRSHPELSGPYANLGMVLLARQDYENAEAALNRARQLNPGNPEIYNQLGLACRQDGRFEQALSYYRQGLEVAPDNLNLLRNTGILLELYLNQHEAALAHYQRYIELQPEDRQVQIWIADLSRRVGS